MRQNDIHAKDIRTGLLCHRIIPITVKSAPVYEGCLTTLYGPSVINSCSSRMLISNVKSLPRARKQEYLIYPPRAVMNAPRRKREVGRIVSGLPENTRVAMIFWDINSVGFLAAKITAASQSAMIQHIVWCRHQPSEHLTIGGRCCVKSHTFNISRPERCFNIISSLVEGAFSLTLGGGFGDVTPVWRPTIATKIHGSLMRDPIILGKRLGSVRRDTLEGSEFIWRTEEAEN